MRYTFILLFVLSSYNAAFSQKSKPATGPVISRYYYFTGTIDKYPVTFHLYRINEKFTGNYYYNSAEEPIELSGEIGKDNFLKLVHYDSEYNESEILSGNFKDSSYAGTWSYNGKLLSFRITQKKENNGLAFDYIYTTGSKKLPKGDDYSRPELSYDAAAIWPAASSTHPATNLIKQVIRETFGVKEGEDEIGKIMIARKNSFLNYEKDKEITEYALSSKAKVEYQNAQLLTISDFGYTDGGGAHGIYGTVYVCIDLINNRKLAITDVLDTLTCRKNLHSLLVKKFRAAYKLKPDEKLSEVLFADDIPLTDNFFLTSKGIGFHYNPYEVGAYALGNVQVYIPFKELSNCLNPAFKKLVGIN
ncbi:RsiV family protein [Longitalea arenae]|uniref:RsiV family protein n=1 Tax=Longitalea arenae TaxID=2812558 RepID=UPI0019685CFE|nr:RsiV family protein [Longitalea arenae]